MNKVYILLGGNKGERLLNIEKAGELIQKFAGPISNKSKIYVTAAWGNENQPDFFNQVVCISTKLSAIELLNCLLSIENQLGRIRGIEKWQERTIDIDILFFNNEIINLPNLTIPHPFLQERKFTLIPFSEIAPDFIHPIFQKTISTLNIDCKDQLKVNELKQ